MKAQGLPARERLCAGPRFGELFERGRTGKSRSVLVKALPNDLPHVRMAAIAGRTAGIAARRNRLKRRLRAAYRSVRTTLPPGWDLVLLARRDTATTAFDQLVRDLRNAVERATTGD